MKASNIFQNKGVKAEGGKGPEIKGIGSPFKKRKGCGPQRLGSPMKMGMKHSSPTKFNAGLKKAAADGKLDKNPKFKAAVESSPAKMKTAKQKAGGSFDKPVGTKAGAEKRKAIIAKVKKEGEAKVSASAKKSPAKKYKSHAQRKAVHAHKADGGKGAPAKMYKKSPAKKYKKASPAKAHCNKK